MKYNRPILIAFIAGAGLGTALGVLFAPASGKETRKKIKNKTQKRKQDLTEAVEHGREELSKAKDQVSGSVKMTMGEVTGLLQFLFEEGRELFDRLKSDQTDYDEEVLDAAEPTKEYITYSTK